MTVLSMRGTNPAPKKESKKTEPKAPKLTKPVHPGLDVATQRDQAWCRKCGAPVEFREVWGNALCLGICECGLWVKDRRDFVRLLRFDTAAYMVGEGPLYYSKGNGERT